MENRTFADQFSSPFLRLPVQLRTMIYQHLFFDQSVEVYWDRNDRGGYYYCHTDVFALLATCRQIHSEAYNMYISMATFRLQHIGVRAFLEDYPPNNLTLVTSIVCQSDQQDIWIELPAVKGRALVALRRVHFLMVPWSPVLEREKVRVMIDKITRGRVSVEKVEITFEE